MLNSNALDWLSIALRNEKFRKLYSSIFGIDFYKGATPAFIMDSTNHPIEIEYSMISTNPKKFFLCDTWTKI